MPLGDVENMLEYKYVFPKIGPSSGGWPIADFRPIISKDIFEKITAKCDRLRVEGVARKAAVFSLRNSIRGGMVIPHIHVGDEIILLDKMAMKNYFQAVAEAVDKIEDISDVKAYLRF